MWIVSWTYVHFHLLYLDSLRSITANLDHVDSSVTENIVLAAIESIIGNMDIVMELKAAVNMLKLVRSLVKHINDNKAYEQFVGKYFVRWSSWKSIQAFIHSIFYISKIM